ERLDDFTLSLLSNDEVLAIDQDALGKGATCIEQGPKVTIKRSDRPDDKGFQLAQGQIWSKQLADGSRAVGLFNAGESELTIPAKFADLQIEGSQTVRDLWRQKDIGSAEGEYKAQVPPHGVVLVKLTPSH